MTPTAADVLPQAHYRYEMLNGVVRHVVGRGPLARVIQTAPGADPKFINDDHHEIWSPKAQKHALALGLRYHAITPYALRDLFEDEAVEKRHLNGWFYEATVRYLDEDYDVVLHVLSRTVSAIRLAVRRYASLHAVARAKERYGLVLDTQTAKEMVTLLRAGEGQVLSENEGGVKVALTYDHEVFTIVWSPETETIITIVPSEPRR